MRFGPLGSGRHRDFREAFACAGRFHDKAYPLRVVVDRDGDEVLGDPDSLYVTIAPGPDVFAAVKAGKCKGMSWFGPIAYASGL